MQARPYHLVNVFACGHFDGNPLAVFPQSDNLTDDEMQAIARQFNLSETVFIFSSNDDKAAASLRIFTPNYELPLAGHPTLGSAFILKQLNHLLPDEFILNTKAKPVQVFINKDHVQMKIKGFDITKSQTDKPSLAKLSGLDVDDIVGRAYFVNSGTQQILIELSNRQALRNLHIDIAKLRALNAENPFKSTKEPSIYYWVCDGKCIHSRMFFEQNSVMVEDSGTGSACANLGAYFISQNNYPLTHTICQGDDMGRANRLLLKIDDEQNIYVGGQVIQVGRGEFYLPN